MLIQVRRDTATNWNAKNPTLAAGEIGYETTSGKVKVGDGSTAWVSLPYIGSSLTVRDTDSDPLFTPNTLVFPEGTLENSGAGVATISFPDGTVGYQANFTGSTIVVNHNLGYRPNVTVIDTAGDECEGMITHNSVNQLTLVFSTSFSGTVYCS